MPGKKRKGKMSKLSKMDDEERARYLQHRADMEEEARRRKHQLISNFITIKLTKEDTYSLMNTAKLNVKWRQILREVSCEQTKVQIKGMADSFSFLLSKKNRLIEFLSGNIQKADDQHRTMFQDHIETISRFMEIGSAATLRLQNEFECQRNHLLEQWERENVQLSENQHNAEFHLNMIRFQINTAMDKLGNQQELKLATAKNDGFIERREALNELRKPKELEMELLWNQIRHTYSNYLEKHAPIMVHYNALREKDDFYKRDITRINKQITKLTRTYGRLHTEYDYISQQLEKDELEIYNQREVLAQQFQKLKVEIKKSSHADGESLAILVEFSEDAIAKLETAKRKLDKINQFHKICEKKEKKIKNLTKWKSRYSERKIGNECKLGLENIESMVDVEHLDQLGGFLLMVAHARLENDNLYKEKLYLKAECEKLKATMRERLMNIALNDGFSDSRQRPNSVQCCHSMGGRREEHTWNNRPVTCIEAKLSNAILHEKREKLFQIRNKNSATISAIPFWKSMKVWPAS